LHVEYRATTNRMLRVAVNSFMESLNLVIEVMQQLDTDVLPPVPATATA
jgi:EKC/KEOPS complex subunit PCC1/LAGE3